MSETKYIEGVVTTAEYPEGKQGKVVIDGQTWFMEKHEYRGEPFHEPRVGENVRLGLESWTKRDGSIGWTAKTSELLEPADQLEAFKSAVGKLSDGYVATDWGPKRRLDALNAAREDFVSWSEGKSFDATHVVARAETYARFIEGDRA